MFTHQRWLWPLAGAALVLSACTPTPQVLVVTSTPPPVVATATAATAEPASPQPPTATPPPAATVPVEAGFVCQLAYADDNTLACLSEAQKPIPIAETNFVEHPFGKPEISGDGAWVAYSVTGLQATELWVVEVGQLQGEDGLGLPRRLLADSTKISPALFRMQMGNQSYPLRYAWQPGTHTLFFNTYTVVEGSEVGPRQVPNNDLWQVDAVTGQVTAVLPANSAELFALSPDGQWVAWASFEKVGRMRVDGSAKQELLTFPPILTYSEYAYVPQLTWQTDSTAFNFVLPSPDPMAADTSAGFYRAGVTESAAQLLATVPGNFVFGGGGIVPAFAPDGTHVVYAQINTSDVVTFHVVKADGTAVKSEALPPSQTFGFVGWAPDGQRMAVTLYPQGGLYVEDLAGQRTIVGGDELLTTDVKWRDAQSFYFFGGGMGQTSSYYLVSLADGKVTTEELVSQVALTSIFDVLEAPR